MSWSLIVLYDCAIESVEYSLNLKKKQKTLKRYEKEFSDSNSSLLSAPLTQDM